MSRLALLTRRRAMHMHMHALSLARGKLIHDAGAQTQRPRPLHTVGTFDPVAFSSAEPSRPRCSICRQLQLPLLWHGRQLRQTRLPLLLWFCCVSVFLPRERPLLAVSTPAAAAATTAIARATTGTTPPTACVRSNPSRCSGRDSLVFPRQALQRQ